MSSTNKKKLFPKKAKLISEGGLYRIISIERFIPIIQLPIIRTLMISIPEFYYEEPMKFLLKFQFDKVVGNYAEYRQFDFIKLKN